MTKSRAPIGLVPLLLLAGCPGPQPSDTDGDSDAPSTATQTTLPTTSASGFELLCEPGASRCADGKTLETCKNTGLSYEQSSCTKHQTCIEGECIGPCEKAAETPSSVGCEFVAIRMRSVIGTPQSDDGLIVGNTDVEQTAEVQLYFVPNNSHTEEPLGDPVALAPGESHIFHLTSDVLQGYSTVRVGGIYHVKSDIPITAYLHSPLENTDQNASNDSSLLLPLHALRSDYVIASYPGFVDDALPDDINGRPSYFDVIALTNETTVTWTPPRDTAGDGLIVKPISAGTTGHVTLNRFDVLQVGSTSKTNFQYDKHDVSGTVVSADHPIWVVGATRCAFIPFGVQFCNHLQEQMIPLAYWGKTYVGAHSPLRGGEDHIWRVYAGADGVSVTTDPPQPGTPFTLNKRGEWKELAIANGTSFVFQGTDAFMPVQYLAGFAAAGEIGDPSMYQMIPVEQWLRRYVFVTGKNYDLNYAQVIRRYDGADVTIGGQTVTGYYVVNTVSGGKYEIADFLLPGGHEATSYLAESADEFSVVVIGYKSEKPTSAYAYPGGLDLKPIFQP
jgi:hypothetical protein